MVCPKPEVTPETVLPRPEVVFWAAEPMGPPSWGFGKKGGVSEGGRGGSGVDCSKEKKSRRLNDWATRRRRGKEELGL